MIQARLDTPEEPSATPVPQTREVQDLLWRVTFGRPHLLIAACILAILSAGWLASFLLRFEFSIPERQAAYMKLALPFVLAAYLLSLSLSGVFRILRTYVAVRDALAIARGTTLAAVALYLVNAAFVPAGWIPRSVLILHGILAPVGICAFYLAIRVIREFQARKDSQQPESLPTLIVGAGNSGDALMREIERAPAKTLRVVGFIDDDPYKRGGLLRGVPVLGPVSDMLRIVKERSIRQVMVALPSAGGAKLRSIVSPLLEAGIQVRTLPSLLGLSTNTPLLPQLKEVAVEDLLRREPVPNDEERSKQFLRGKNVLVTGAAGSIGMELCRQILKYQPARLVALDCAETPLHDLMLEIGKGKAPCPVYPEMGDVTDPVRIRALFAAHSPDVVFHAAALKHVPVCENHPREAVRVNVGGTKIVANQARRSGVGLFVLISTDKAVNPSSIMGATKRCAELLLQGMASDRSATRFAAVRFGNVLGSNGSVLKIFRSQIERGGPLTVTHPDMRRYFMTIPEAVELVLQAAFMTGGGEIFELDMGNPVKIVDLAEDFIRLSGRTPGQDVKIEFTGIRPGEKLFEELYCHEETVSATDHPKVFCLKPLERFGGDPAVRKVLDRLGGVNADEDPVVARLADDLQALLGEREAASVAAR